jgi:ABC-type lipoprotein export system ATPase subunit
LLTLQDATVYEDVRAKFESEPCFKISLLRDSKDIELLATAGKRFGAAENMIGKFTASIRLDGSSAPHKFDFNFEPHGGLPHRVSAVVGLNGVGKTQIMAKLAMSVSRFSKKSVKEKSSALDENNMLDPVPSIFNVVAVSFSAFDEFDRPTQKQGEDFNYSYCGLQTQRGRLKTKDDLLSEIKNLISQGMTDDKRTLLKQVLGNLVRVEDMESFIDNPELHQNLYERLSAGQRIALNCICHILSKISPRTLVLFDEPEVHLHPQFLTGMLHALSEILSTYDSFSIIATHSPLVVQQLPRRSVYVVRRDRMMPIILKPTFETFGESLAEITRFIFTATEADRDYKSVLDELLQSGKSADDILQLFDGKLGLNAVIYLQSLDALS